MFPYESGVRTRVIGLSSSRFSERMRAAPNASMLCTSLYESSSLLLGQNYSQCVCKRERERETERKGEKRESVCKGEREREASMLCTWLYDNLSLLLGEGG